MRAHDIRCTRGAAAGMMSRAWGAFVLRRARDSNSRASDRQRIIPARFAEKLCVLLCVLLPFIVRSDYDGRPKPLCVCAMTSCTPSPYITAVGNATNAWFTIKIRARTRFSFVSRSSAFVDLRVNVTVCLLVRIRSEVDIFVTSAARRDASFFTLARPNVLKPVFEKIAKRFG